MANDTIERWQQGSLPCEENAARQLRSLAADELSLFDVPWTAETSATVYIGRKRATIERKVVETGQETQSADIDDANIKL